MTTEEIKNKLKISENTCIYCPTLELVKQVLIIFNQLGLKWCSKKHYIRYTNWDNFKENTVHHPFDGEFSSLEFAREIGCKVINAKEFLALHTEEEEFDLENYIPKGGLEGFPKEIIARMLECQEKQGNPRDISVFEKLIDAGQCIEGFDWDETQEDYDFWREVIRHKDFDRFFEKYPKKDNQDNSQEFRIGDKVIYYLTNKIGTVDEVKKHKFDNDIDIVVDFGNNDICEYEVNSDIIRPFLLHYRDDYNYDVIEF